MEKWTVILIVTALSFVVSSGSIGWLLWSRRKRSTSPEAAVVRAVDSVALLAIGLVSAVVFAVCVLFMVSMLLT